MSHGPRLLTVLTMRLVAVVVLTMLIGGLPVLTATAAPSGGQPQPLPYPDLPDLDSLNAVGPVPELSTQTSTTKRNADGTYTAEISGDPVNYRGTNGAWTPINNEFVPAPGSTYELQNAANDYRALLPTDPTTDPVKFTTGDDWVKLKMSGLADAVPEADGTQATLDLRAGGDRVTYEATSSGLKENIILEQAPSAPVTYLYALEVSSGLQPRIDDAGNVSFTNGVGAQPFFIPAGNMSDSASPEPAFSTNVTYALTSTTAGYRLAVTPNFAWLADPARIYPVAIDPTIDTNPPKDCWMQQDTPNTSRCNANFIWAGLVNNSRRRGLLDFRINSIPTDGATVQSAELFLWLDTAYSGPTGGATQWGLYQPGYDWSQAANWGNSGVGGQPWIGGNPGALRSNLISLGGGGVSGWKQWNVIDFVSNWRAGSLPNRGMLLKQEGENFRTGLAFVGQAQNNGYKPILRITYINQSPLGAALPTISPRGSGAEGVVGTTPIVGTTVFDPDTAMLYAYFGVRDASSGALVWQGFSASSGTGGTRLEAAVPTGALAIGARYAVTATGFDGSSYGPYSPWAYFTIEDPAAQPPTAARPTVTPLNNEETKMRPALRTVVTKPSGGQVTATFNVFNNSTQTLVWSGQAEQTVPSGQAVSVELPRGALTAGVAYYATAVGRDDQRAGPPSVRSAKFIPHYGINVGDDLDATIDPVPSDLVDGGMGSSATGTGTTSQPDSRPDGDASEPLSDVPTGIPTEELRFEFINAAGETTATFDRSTPEQAAAGPTGVFGGCSDIPSRKDDEEDEVWVRYARKRLGNYAEGSTAFMTCGREDNSNGKGGFGYYHMYDKKIRDGKLQSHVDQLQKLAQLVNKDWLQLFNFGVREVLFLPEVATVRQPLNNTYRRHCYAGRIDILQGENLVKRFWLRVGLGAKAEKILTVFPADSGCGLNVPDEQYIYVS